MAPLFTLRECCSIEAHQAGEEPTIHPESASIAEITEEIVHVVSDQENVIFSSKSNEAGSRREVKRGPSWIAVGGDTVENVFVQPLSFWSGSAATEEGAKCGGKGDIGG